MAVFLGKIFGKKLNTKKFLGKVKKISELTDKISKQSKQLENEEYGLILESKDDVYMSLTSFLDLMKEDDLSMTKIMESCVHISDIKDTDVAYLDVHAIPDNKGHVVLCADPKKCEDHSDYDGDPIRIVSLRRK